MDLNKELQKIIDEQSSYLNALEPIDVATDAKLEEVILAINQTINKQNEIINAINSSSIETTKYAKKTIRVAWFTIVLSLIIGLAQIYIAISSHT